MGDVGIIRIEKRWQTKLFDDTWKCLKTKRTSITDRTTIVVSETLGTELKRKSLTFVVRFLAWTPLSTGLSFAFSYARFDEPLGRVEPPSVINRLLTTLLVHARSFDLAGDPVNFLSAGRNTILISRELERKKKMMRSTGNRIGRTPRVVASGDKSDYSIIFDRHNIICTCSQ